MPRGVKKREPMAVMRVRPSIDAGGGNAPAVMRAASAVVREVRAPLKRGRDGEPMPANLMCPVLTFQCMKGIRRIGRRLLIGREMIHRQKVC